MADSPLTALEGTWDVAWAYRTAPGVFAESQAEAQITQDVLGCVLVEHFEGTLNDHPFHALTMISAPRMGHYERVRIDSEHGGFTQSAGQMQADSLVFTWQRDLGTRLLRTRHVYSDLSPSAFSVTFYMSPRADAPWQVVQRARYVRHDTPE